MKLNINRITKLGSVFEDADNAAQAAKDVLAELESGDATGDERDELIQQLEDSNVELQSAARELAGYFEEWTKG